jgi:peptide subunit release factor 1 (eRF1)
MLDELLGRASLKEEIQALETQNERLRDRLEAEERRRSEAVSDRQRAEERVNRLEDRVAELEDRVERATDSGDRDEPTFRYRRELRGGRLATVVDRLHSFDAPPDGALTAYIDGEIPDAVSEAFGDRTVLLHRASPCLVCRDDAGLVSIALSLVDPPEPFHSWGPAFEVQREWAEPSGSHAVALVRSDLFAVGIYEGSERLSVRGFETNVKRQHSKGGFSQARFERIREGQVRDHLDRAHQVLDEVDTDRLFVVGTGELLGEFGDRADVMTSVDATGDPEAALDDAVRDLWTVTAYGV